VEEKGFDTAIAAAQAAGVPLVVAGEGPDEDRLRGLAAAGGNVRFEGRVAETRLAELRAQAGVVLIPSRWEEPCPYAALDALAAGVPVLASAMGGLPELVDPDSVLPPDDPRRWTEALRTLWNDPEARRVQGERALEDACRRLSADTYYEQLMTVYTE
jgi:glycosyltransferase involved in cell wall biosynthesis